MQHKIMTSLEHNNDIYDLSFSVQLFYFYLSGMQEKLRHAQTRNIFKKDNQLRLQVNECGFNNIALDFT